MQTWLEFMLTPRRIIISIVVLILGMVMIRLGIWQLDRLQQRKASNARIIAQMDAPAINLNESNSYEGLSSMQYRKATATGSYDFSQQVFLTNQVWQNQLGVHLLTPFIIAGSSRAVLVDRGWIPMADASVSAAKKYDEPGQVTLNGIIQIGQNEPIFGISDPQLSPGQDRLQTWIVVNLERIGQQIDPTILPVYLQITPPSQNNRIPYRVVTTPDLSNGPHLSYALQWFSFTIILWVGYPIIIRRQYRSEKKKTAFA